jgi:hypothetical protein
MSTEFNAQIGNGEYRLQFETDNKKHYLLLQEMARRCVDGKPVAMDLGDTVAAMCSEDYKARFMAEYYQTKIRYEKLKAFNTKIEAAKRTQYYGQAAVVDMPKHDCPDDLLLEQQTAMGNYLHILEVRAQIEGVAL